MATSALNGDIVDIYTTFQFVGNVCLHLLEILQTNVQIEAHIHNNIVSNCQDCCHRWIDQTGSRHRCFIRDASLLSPRGPLMPEISARLLSLSDLIQSETQSCDNRIQTCCCFNCENILGWGKVSVDIDIVITVPASRPHPQ